MLHVVFSLPMLNVLQGPTFTFQMVNILPRPPENLKAKTFVVQLREN